MSIVVPAFKPYVSKERKAKFLEYAEEIINSRVLTGGQYVKKLEKGLAKLCGKRFAVATNSWAGAMELILAYYKNVEKKKRLYMCALNYTASYLCAKRVGLEVKFVDADSDLFTIDWTKLNRDDEGLVLLTDFFGYHYYDIEQFVKEKDMPIVYDAAQAIGSIQTDCDFALSFHASKILGAGEGGALLTDNEDLYEFALRGRAYGMIGRRHHVYGYNFKMPELIAAFLYAGLDDVGYVKEFLKDNVELYESLLPNMMYSEVVKRKGVSYDFNGLAPVLLIEPQLRQTLRMMLFEDYGVEHWGTAAEYLPLEPLCAGEDVYPTAKKHAFGHVLLPNFYEMSVEQIEYVADAVLASLKRIRENDYSADMKLWSSFR